MKKLFFIFFSVLFFSKANAQSLAINTDGSTADASSILDVKSTAKGLLIPRVALTSVADAGTIASPATSLLVYNLGSGGLAPAGYYYNSGSPGTPVWIQLITSVNAWNLTGNAGTVDGTHFIGTTDDVPFNIRQNNQQAGKIGTSATGNIFLGLLTGNANTSGLQNSALGSYSLRDNTAGSDNAALGYSSLLSNVANHGSTAVGSYAMQYANNTASGSFIHNTAVGLSALRGSVTPANNIGTNNTAIGSEAMLNNSSGSENTALGRYSLRQNTTGSNNTAVGINALHNNISGTGNVAVGYGAGFTETTSNKLYIENSTANKDNALIYGDFAADSLLLNAKTINKNSMHIRNNNALEMGYGIGMKQTDAGKIQYGGFGGPAHTLNIVGGGIDITGSDRKIKLWTQGGFMTGINTIASGTNGATAMGRNTIASGANGATAIGYGSTASGTASTAMGFNTTASEVSSTAMGYASIASGENSTAMGSVSAAIGDNSIVMGENTIARSYASLATGRYNDTIAGSSKIAWVATDPLLTIGNGSSPLLISNAVTVYKNGNTDLNGYVRLGKVTDDAPLIKMKTISGTSPAVDNLLIYPTGIADAKVLSFAVLVEYNAGSKIPPSYIDAAGYEYNVQFQGGNVVLINKTGNSASIGAKPFRVLITYEE